MGLSSDVGNIARKLGYVRAREMLIIPRYRPLRHLRQCPVRRWARLPRPGFLHHRYPHVLHRPGPRRAGSALPHRWFLLCLLNSLPGPRLGICHGLEVSVSPLPYLTQGLKETQANQLIYCSYAVQWLVVLPLELVAASITLTFWPGAAGTNSAAFVTIFLAVIVAINFFGVRGYGEAEFVFAIIKVVAVIGFIILGIILNCGGGTEGGYIGGRYWYPNTVDPSYAGYHTSPPQAPGSILSGSFAAGFKGLCSVFVTAAFTFGGTELVGLAAAEADNPRKSLPTAIKQVFWRICLFYIVALAIVSLLVPYGDARLLGSSSEDAKASPFVIAINNAGIQVLPSVMNVVILISVLSVGNSSIYGSSRTLAALAEQGQAPRILAYIDRRGRPLVAIITASVLGLLCYVVGGGQTTAATALNWLYSLSGLSSIFTWGSICLAHIRFRAAWKHQGHTLDELAFRSQAGLIGSWIGFILNVLVLIAQFWTAAWPIAFGTLTSDERAQTFFLNFLAAPVVIACYVPYKIYFKTPFMRVDNIDLVTGRREMDTRALIEQDRAEQAQWPAWKRVYKIFC
jgi:yeast amino acid transporter